MGGKKGGVVVVGTARRRFAYLFYLISLRFFLLYFFLGLAGS